MPPSQQFLPHCAKTKLTLAELPAATPRLSEEQAVTVLRRFDQEERLMDAKIEAARPA